MSEKKRKSIRQWEAYIELNVTKVPYEQILQEMRAEGYSDDQINQIYGSKKNKHYTVAIILVVLGIVFTIAGIALSVDSYDSAYSSRYGGTYYVFWGLVLVGIVSFITGIYRLVTKKG